LADYKDWTTTGGGQGSGIGAGAGVATGGTAGGIGIGTGTLAGPLLASVLGVGTGGLAGPAYGVLGAAYAGGALGKAVGIALTAADYLDAKDFDVADRLAVRDIVNSYVWTASGGFYAETTTVAEARQESTSTSYSFGGDVKGGMELGVSADIGPQYGMELNGSQGGQMSRTRTRIEDSDRSFSIDITLDVPGDLQAFERSTDGKQLLRKFDGETAISLPGKVDAYRFMTFYLHASAENTEHFFNKVVDPVWLENSMTPAARALEKAAQDLANRPQAWRIMHRVTFVSRVLETPDPGAPTTLETASAQIGFASHWELIRRLDPLIRDAARDRATFRKRLRDVVPDAAPGIDLDNERIRTAFFDLFEAYYGVLPPAA
jgi:hypothetical protein